MPPVDKSRAVFSNRDIKLQRNKSRWGAVTVYFNDITLAADLENMEDLLVYNLTERIIECKMQTKIKTKPQEAKELTMSANKDLDIGTEVYYNWLSTVQNSVQQFQPNALNQEKYNDRQKRTAAKDHRNR